MSVFTTRGEKLRSFGRRGYGRGQFHDPHGMTLDHEGNILIADRGNDRIQKLTLVREFYQIFGKSGNKFPTKKFLHRYVC